MCLFLWGVIFLEKFFLLFCATNYRTLFFILNKKTWKVVAIKFDKIANYQ